MRSAATPPTSRSSGTTRPSSRSNCSQQTVDRLFTPHELRALSASRWWLCSIFIAMVFINNTIRLAILARRKEIAIMRLVGASNGFIRGPFLMEGALHAIISSLLAVGCP